MRDRAARRREQRRQHLDGGGLAGAVGAEEREDLARGDVERDVVDRCDLAERLHQIMNMNHAVAPAMQRRNSNGRARVRQASRPPTPKLRRGLAVPLRAKADPSVVIEYDSDRDPDLTAGGVTGRWIARRGDELG